MLAASEALGVGVVVSAFLFGFRYLQFGLDVVQAYMRHVQDNAEESVRRVITTLKDGAFTLALDNGAQISVAIRVESVRKASSTMSFISFQ